MFPPVFSWQKALLQAVEPAAGIIITGDSGDAAGEFTLALAHRLCGTGGNGGSGGEQKASAANPDLLITLPENQHISVAAVRYLIDFMALTPVKCPRRVAVILRADCLHLSAANALLKTLEEPHTDKSLVLWVPTLQQLPATIISRCHVYPAPPVVAAEAAEATEGEVEVADADMVAFCSGSALAARDYPPEWATLLAHHFGQGGAIDVFAAATALNVQHDHKPGWQAALAHYLAAGCPLNPLCQEWEEKSTAATAHSWLEGLLKWVADGVRVAAQLPPLFFPRNRETLQQLAGSKTRRWLDFYAYLLERRALSTHPLSKELFIRDILYAYRRLCAD